MVTQEPPISEVEPTVTVVEQDKYFLDSIGKIGIITLLCAAVCVVLVAIFMILDPIRNPKALYFRATEAEQLIQDIPLNLPNVSITVLLNWVTENMMDLHSFNFINYASIIEDNRKHFTKDGFDTLLEAFRANKIVETVLEKKYVIRGVPSSAPHITKEGTLANFYLWKITIPMTLYYRNVDTSRLDDVEITLLVVRVPTTEAPFGIQILKYDLLIKT